jgi:putative ABC transport system ATP-binding protein
MSRPPDVVEVDDLRKTYRRGSIEVHALRGVSFSLPPGAVLAVMGASGSGKTTLLNIIAGLDTPTSGAVRIDGRQVGGMGQEEATVFRRRNIGFIFQFFNLLPTMTARENVALPLMAERVERTDAMKRTDTALDVVGLRNRADHRPAELSGGEMQRVAIARALVMNPRLLLADEPTGNLDTAAGDEILGLLRRAVEERGLSIVMVTHAPLAAAMADRVLLLRDGEVVDDIDARRTNLRLAWPGPSDE